MDCGSFWCTTPTVIRPLPLWLLMSAILTILKIAMDWRIFSNICYFSAPRNIPTVASTKSLLANMAVPIMPGRQQSTPVSSSISMPITLAPVLNQAVTIRSPILPSPHTAKINFLLEMSFLRFFC